MADLTQATVGSTVCSRSRKSLVAATTEVSFSSVSQVDRSREGIKAGMVVQRVSVTAPADTSQ